MTRLDACYFCGDIGESLTRYDVVPDSLEPSEDEQRTVALCSRCHRKLESVLEPFVDRLDATGAGPAGVGGESEPTSIEIETSDDAEPSGADAESRGGTEPSESVGSDADESVDAGDDEGASEPADDGVTIPEADGDGATEPGAGVESDAAVESDPAAEAGDGEESGPADESDSPGRAETEGLDDDAPESDAAAAPPSGYHKVMRLLRNRDLPMARSAAEELASSAYDLRASQAREIIDAAVERGMLVEEGGQIRRA